MMAKVPASEWRKPPARPGTSGHASDHENTIGKQQVMPEADMRAYVGDRLIIEGDPKRTGIVIGVPHADGSPPYVVKWLADGHIAMVSPDQYMRIIPAGHPAGTAFLPAAAQ